MNDRAITGIKTSLVSMAAGGILATVKLVAGILGRSSALIADAVESFADIVSSAIVWGGLRWSAKPPDEDHPYGHGKAEPLAALAVGFLLIGAAVGIAVNAIGEVLVPQEPPAAFTLVVLLGVIVTKSALARYMKRVGAEIDSLALRADAWHHQSDAITSFIAAVGISVSLFAGVGYESADDWAALAASFVIAVNGGWFLREAGLELMDTSPNPKLVSDVTAAAMTVDGVRAVEKVLARKVGVDYWVDMHIEVDAEITVREGHDLAHQAKDAIQHRRPEVAEVTIHVEPHEFE
jgi:cation diffusion facilitator family transporter